MIDEQSGLRATATLPADMDFIPPQTFISKELMGITNQGIDKLPDSAFQRKRVRTTVEGHQYIKLASFTPESSPLVFRSYLTIMVGDTLPKPAVYQHCFYVSELVLTERAPGYLAGYKRGDRFYVEGTVPDSIGYGYGIIGNKPVLLKSAPPMH